MSEDSTNNNNPRTNIVYLKGLRSNVIALEFADFKLNKDLFECIHLTHGVESKLYNAFLKGRMINPYDVFVGCGEIYEIKFKLLGGKGGFGSLLKGQPPVKKRTNNFESCRDLSGRRLRHVNQEKNLQDWQQKRMEEKKYLDQYVNNGDTSGINDRLVQHDSKTLEMLDEKYQIEDESLTNVVGDSLKFIKKKRQRESANKKIKSEKEDEFLIPFTKQDKRKSVEDKILKAILDNNDSSKAKQLTVEEIEESIFV